MSVDRVSEGVADAVGNVVGAFAGAPFAGDPLLSNAISGLVAPTVSTTIKSSIDAFRARNTNAVVAIAAEGLDESIETMLERIATDPQLMDVFLRTLRAAETTNQAEKILALGRTLRSVLQDDALYDSEVSLLRAIERLEGAHLRLLTAFDRQAEEWTVLETANGGAIGNHQIDALPLNRLEERSGLGDGTYLLAEQLVVLGLVGRGRADSVPLVEQFNFSRSPMVLRDADGSVPVWYRKPFGDRVLERLSFDAAEGSL